MLNVFDAYGRLAIDPEKDEDAINSLEDRVRAVLFEMIDAVHARDRSEARVLAARTDVREKENAYNQSAHAFNQTTLADEPHAEARRSPKFLNGKDAERTAAIKQASAAQLPGYVSPKVKPNKLKSAMDAANVALTDARAELARSTGELRRLELNAGAAIDAFRRCQTTPSAEKVRRDYINASTAERAARVAAGLSAEPVKPVSPHQSELDRVLGARGKTKTNRTPAYHGRR